jgi:hypothetical protein
MGNAITPATSPVHGGSGRIEVPMRSSSLDQGEMENESGILQYASNYVDERDTARPYIRRLNNLGHRIWYRQCSSHDSALAMTADAVHHAVQTEWVKG